MNQGLWTGRRAAALLAGLFVALAASTARADEPPEPDFAFVPPDAAACLTVRAADLVGKFGIKDAAGKHPWDVAWRRSFGIPLHNVTRCTLVCPDFDPESGATCVIIHTDKPYKRAQVLKACAPDAKQVKHHKKICHVSPTNHVAVHFVNDRLLIVADAEKALAACLKPAKPLPADGPLADALELAGRHDVVLWSRAVAPPNVAPNPFMFLGCLSRPGGQVACYKAPLTGTPGPAVVTTRKPTGGAADADPSLVMLGLLPFPLPAGVESGVAVVDIGDQIDIEMALSCSDKETVRRVGKLVRTCVKALRAELLMVVSMLDLADVYPTMKGDFQGLRSLPLKLIRQGEKGLQRAEIVLQGNKEDMSVGMKMTIPLNAKTLCSELTKLVPMNDAEAGGKGGACLSFPSLGGGAYAPACPAPYGNTYAVPPAPVVMPESSVAPPTPTPGLSGGCWGNPQAPTPPGASTMPPLMPRPCAALDDWYGAGPSFRSPTSTPSVPTSMPRPTDAPVDQPANPGQPNEVKLTVAEVKLTVANVRKESAQLFKLTDGGKLTFLEKVEPGEAVDIQTAPGQRLVVVFRDSADSDTFVPTQANTTWLLRPEAVATRRQW